jgi:hypothetical protein
MRRETLRASGLAAAGVLLLTLAACTADPRPLAGEMTTTTICNAPADLMVRSELIFGTARPGGRTVSEAEWTDFLAAEVTPRFPDGLTVLSGLGQWRGGDGRLVRERSKVLIVLREPAESTDADIEAIRSAYRRRFDQESVIRGESVSCVSF